MPITSRLVAAALLCVPLAAGAADLSPVGTWRTFDESGHETGAVTIHDVGGVLVGNVAAIRDPSKAAGACQKCSDDRRDKPVLGMEVIRGVRANGDQWDGGEILDPEAGKIYRVKMRLAEGGTKLVLRGFIGISLFGRTQTWLRVMQTR